jgi:hypothetical protein
MVNTSFLTSLYLFEDVFRKKLSKNEIFFVISPKIIELCTISDCQTKRF